MHLGGYHRNHSLFIPSELIRVTRKGLGTGCGLHGEPPRTKPRTHSLTLWGPGRWQSEGQHPACHQAPRRAHLRLPAGPSRVASPMGSFERSVGTGAPRPELSSQAGPVLVRGETARGWTGRMDVGSPSGRARKRHPQGEGPGPRTRPPGHRPAWLPGGPSCWSSCPRLLSRRPQGQRSRTICPAPPSCTGGWWAPVRRAPCPPHHSVHSHR